MIEEKTQEIELPLTGLHCSGCAQNLEKHLKKIGLQDVNVDFASAIARFTLHQDHLLPRIQKEIEKLGYGVGGRESKQPLMLAVSLKAKFIFSLIWTAPLFAHMFLPFHFLGEPVVQLVLCLPVFILGLLHFGRSAWGSLRRGYSNMDVLITVSITAAFVYSLSGTILGLGPDYLFYETSATITTIVLLGNLLEERAVKKTSSAIEELAKIQPSSARQIVREGERESVRNISSAALKPGDEVLINSGDRVPADGEIFWGAASVDQSMITGESMPAEKESGEKVIGGTLVVKGAIKARISAVGSDMVLANMIRLVRQAQSHKPRIQRVGDRVSAVFVPAVAVFALLTLLFSFYVLGIGFQSALLNSIAVLVIACPCAMGLATPTAVMAGVGQAAKHGILIKGGDTLERLARARKVIFDKTGTLTSGNLKVKALHRFGVHEENIKSIVLGLERHSSHPIARSLGEEFRGVAAKQFQWIEEKRGLGVIGRDAAGATFEIVSQASKEAARQAPGHDIYVLQDGELIAAIDLADEIKESAAQVIQKLQRHSIEPVMLSGDTQEKCREVASQLGIERFYSQQSPEEKLRAIETIERESETIFVGDGINDAPSLARAAAGVSLSNATQIAIQSAKVVLLDGNLERLLKALGISRSTLRIIKQNLFWAFFYNVLAIPVAAAGYLNPMIAAGAMALSDIIVIFNSLRLKLPRAAEL